MRNLNISNQGTGNTRENRGKLIFKERMTDCRTDERYKSTDDKFKQIMQLVVQRGNELVKTMNEKVKHMEGYGLT